MNAYFDIIVQLMVLMLFCMCIMVPLMLKYASHDALAGHPSWYIMKFSLGNMGGSNTFCTHVPYMDTEAHFNLQCNTGVLSEEALDFKTEKELF